MHTVDLGAILHLKIKERKEQLNKGGFGWREGGGMDEKYMNGIHFNSKWYIHRQIDIATLNLEYFVPLSHCKNLQIKLFLW